MKSIREFFYKENDVPAKNNKPLKVSAKKAV